MGRSKSGRSSPPQVRAEAALRRDERKAALRQRAPHASAWSKANEVQSIDAPPITV
jgi:hypothetical protein